MAPARDLITLQEAADELGVHYMTAYRYVRTGRLPGVKVGSEWRIARGDLDSVASAAGGRQEKASPGAKRRSRRHDYPVEILDPLVAGDFAGSWAVIQNALAAGMNPDEVYMDLLVPALQMVGDGWEEGRITVAEEHQASIVVSRIIGQLGSRFTRPGRKRGSLVVGAAPEDQHGLPTAFLADLLRVKGFRVHDLGGRVPVESFVETAKESERLIAVAICATISGNETLIEQAVTAVKDAAGVPVVLGGGAIRDADHALELGADHYARTAPDVVEVVEGLTRSRRRRSADARS